MRLDWLRRGGFAALATILKLIGFAFSASATLFLKPADWCARGALWCDDKAGDPEEARAQ